MDDQESLPPIKSSAKTLRIVKELHRRNGATLDEVTSAVEGSKSTVHRHLATLYDEGFVIREQGKFYVGYRFLNLGEYTRFRKPEFDIIRSGLHDLANESNHEADHSVIDHGRIIVLHQEHIQVNYWDRRSTGNYFYAHSNAAGKAILAEHSDDVVRDIAKQHGLPAVTQQTITDEVALLDELDEIREAGYALNDEESTEGLRSVGKAIYGADGLLLGAISVSGPRYRIDDVEFQQTLPNLIGRVVGRMEQQFADMPAGTPEPRESIN
jgi:DNA-binding IclR family transcriptional regulator